MRSAEAASPSSVPVVVERLDDLAEDAENATSVHQYHQHQRQHHRNMDTRAF